MLRFIVVRGILIWGIGTGVLFSAIEKILHHNLGVSLVARNLALFMIGGIFWGMTMWWIDKRQR